MVAILLVHTNRFSNAYGYLKSILVTIRNIPHREPVQKVTQECSKNRHFDNICKIGNITSLMAGLPYYSNKS